MDLTSLNKDRKHRKTTIDVSAISYGRVPPQAKQLEDAILGAIMLEGKCGYLSAFEDTSAILGPEAFYVEANQLIFKAMMALNERSSPIDMLMVLEELKSREQLDAVGGPYYLTKLSDGVVSTANIETHARIVLQKFIQRELIRVSGEIIGEAYEDSTDVFDLADDAVSKMERVTSGIGTDKVYSMIDQCMQFQTEFDRRRASDQQIFGVSSGFESIDEVTNGWQPTDMICLAAFSGVGKTAFALNLARNSAKAGTPTGFFCLEMLRAQLTERIVSCESEIALKKIKRGTADDHEDLLVKKAIRTLEKLKLYLDDETYTLPELKRKIRRLVKKYGVKLVVIDYYQLIQLGEVPRGMLREQQLAQISRELKKLAKDIEISIIVLSQVGEKEIVKRANVEPKQSDLRESQSLGNDSDLVIMLYRPGYHDIDVDAEGNSTAGETFAKIVKHRNGALAKLKLISKLHIQKFIDPSQDLSEMGVPKGFVPVKTEEEFPFGKPSTKK